MKNRVRKNHSSKPSLVETKDNMLLTRYVFPMQHCEVVCARYGDIGTLCVHRIGIHVKEFCFFTNLNLIRMNGFHNVAIIHMNLCKKKSTARRKY